MFFDTVTDMTDDIPSEDNPFCLAIEQMIKRFEKSGILTAPDINYQHLHNDVRDEFYKNGSPDIDFDNISTDNISTDNISTDNISTDNIRTNNIRTDNTRTDNISTLANVADDESPKRKPLVLKQNKVSKSLSKKAQKLKTQKSNHCRFCENNNESPIVYSSHGLRDSTGRLTCPRLRQYICPICNASGDDAHTVRYCTQKPIYVVKGDQSCDITKVRSSGTYRRTMIRM